MRPLIALTIANIRSYVRDRQALFWTLAFPLIFIFLFGSIFSGGFNKTKIGWVDEDPSQPAGLLRNTFTQASSIDLIEGDRATILDKMEHGAVSGVVIVPKGFGAGFDAARQGSGPATPVTVYTDPSQQGTSGAVRGLVAGILAQASLAGKAPAVIPEMRDLKTQDLNAISYLVPSILGMALMQLGVFSALPLVADREKLILKRLSATPLRRWQLVGSNVLMRLLIGVVQTALIVGDADRPSVGRFDWWTYCPLLRSVRTQNGPGSTLASEPPFMRLSASRNCSPEVPLMSPMASLPAYSGLYRSVQEVGGVLICVVS